MPTFITLDECLRPTIIKHPPGEFRHLAGLQNGVRYSNGDWLLSFCGPERDRDGLPVRRLERWN